MAGSDGYTSLTLSDSLLLSQSKHASHCLLYAEDDNDNEHTIYGLAQLRFDGLIGFAGGEIDTEQITVEAVVDATNRELEEEINYHLDGVVADDWICSHRLVTHTSDWVQHFFAKRLTGHELRSLESTHHKALHFPIESLGVFRVPIGRTDKTSSPIARKFLRNFLRQQFAGNARQQFIESVTKLSLIGPDDKLWLESSLDYDHSLSTDSISAERVGVLLHSNFNIDYYHGESICAHYGLMVVRSDGLFDFVASVVVEEEDERQMLSALERDLSADTDRKDIVDLLSSAERVKINDESKSYLLSVKLSCEQFLSFERSFPHSSNFLHDSFGLFRVPLSFGRTTLKANNYCDRFFRGCLSQTFTDKSKLLVEVLRHQTFAPQKNCETIYH